MLLLFQWVEAQCRTSCINGKVHLYFLGISGNLVHMKYVQTSYRSENESPRQMAFGTLLFNARKAKGWTREELRDKCGVGISSIVRYERAGIDETGQYPRATTLAVLCITLEIDPLEAIMSCLPPRDFATAEGLSREQLGVLSHPQTRWLEGQFKKAVLDCTMYRSCLEQLLPAISDDDLSEDLRWLKNAILPVMKRHHEFEARMLQLGIYFVPTDDFILPGGHSDDDNASWAYDLSEGGIIDENSPDPKYRDVMVERSLRTIADRLTYFADKIERNISKRKSPEDDLPSPPSSDPKPPQTTNKENDDGRPSD